MDSAGGAEAPKAPPLNPPLMPWLILFNLLVPRYFRMPVYSHFLASKNLGPRYPWFFNILHINLFSGFLKCRSLTHGKCFQFYPSENPVEGLHWIQPQCADAYDKLPSLVGSQPIICFLILDCNKYSQVGSLLAHCFFFFTI